MTAPRKLRLSTTPTPEALADLRLGDIVHLDGLMYTAREGAYMRVLEEKADLPMDLPRESATNFHCAPAATINGDGSFTVGAVTATASFRFTKWIGKWLAKSGAKIVIGKGGMSPETYREHFVPNGAIYLTTVGYGTGALLGRGIERVEAVHWAKELGIAQAMWALRCNDMGPFIVASDIEGNCLFERENAKLAPRLEAAYEGTRPATLKRYGETDDRTDEVIS